MASVVAVTMWIETTGRELESWVSEKVSRGVPQQVTDPTGTCTCAVRRFPRLLLVLQ